MDGIDSEQRLLGLGAGRLGIELQQALARAGAPGGGEAAGSAGEFGALAESCVLVSRVPVYGARQPEPTQGISRSAVIRSRKLSCAA